MIYLLLLLLLLLLLSPNIFLYIMDRDLDAFLLSVVLLVWFYSVVKNSKYLVFLFPLLFFIPFILFYVLNYKTPVNEQILSIIFETNTQEAINFLGYNLLIYILVLFFWLFFIIFIFYKNYKKPLVWVHRSRCWVFLLFSLYIGISFFLNQKVSSQINENFNTHDFLVEERNLFLQDIKKTYPFGLFLTFSDFLVEQDKINKDFDRKKFFKFNAKLKNKNKNKIIVLVIGESSRKQNWELNGYSRETNKKLKYQDNLINLSDMVSVSNATRSSIPIMLTRKPAEKVFSYDFSEKSIISVFNEVKFKTYWLSTQQKFGAFDTSTSVYAKEANNIYFLNKSNYNTQSDLDEILIPKFKEIINNDDGNKFIVVHTLGSHYNYLHRYSGDYDLFKPSLRDIEKYSLQEQKYKNEMLNSYDNSIAYTDYVLNELIELLKLKENTESFLLFSSDHGEDLYVDGCGKSGHGNETHFNFEIASFIWYSNMFKQNNFEKIKNADINYNKKINQTAIFPTLVDAANIEIPKYRLNKSLLRNFEQYPRFIMGKENYDLYKKDGKCLVIK